MPLQSTEDTILHMYIAACPRELKYFPRKFLQRHKELSWSYSTTVSGQECGTIVYTVDMDPPVLYTCITDFDITS